MLVIADIYLKADYLPSSVYPSRLLHELTHVHHAINDSTITAQWFDAFGCVQTHDHYTQSLEKAGVISKYPLIPTAELEDKVTEESYDNLVEALSKNRICGHVGGIPIHSAKLPSKVKEYMVDAIRREYAEMSDVIKGRFSEYIRKVVIDGKVGRDAFISIDDIAISVGEQYHNVAEDIATHTCYFSAMALSPTYWHNHIARAQSEPKLTNRLLMLVTMGILEDNCAHTILGGYNTMRHTTQETTTRESNEIRIQYAFKPPKVKKLYHKITGNNLPKKPKVKKFNFVKRQKSLAIQKKQKNRTRNKPSSA